MFPAMTTTPNLIILVLECVRSHISKEVKAHLHRRKILFCVISGLLTSIIQHVDTFWFKSLKVNLRGLAHNGLIQYMLKEQVCWKFKQPSNKNLAKWFRNSLNFLDIEFIKKGFIAGIFRKEKELIISKDSILGSKFIEEISVLGNSENTQIIMNFHEGVSNFNEIINA